VLVKNIQQDNVLVIHLIKVLLEVMDLHVLTLKVIVQRLKYATMKAYGKRANLVKVV
jgi:hypothetical protein